jgi:hypothetical protein
VDQLPHAQNAVIEQEDFVLKLQQGEDVLVTTKLQEKEKEVVVSFHEKEYRVSYLLIIIQRFETRPKFGIELQMKFDFNFRSHFKIGQLILSSFLLVLIMKT